MNNDSAREVEFERGARIGVDIGCGNRPESSLSKALGDAARTLEQIDDGWARYWTHQQY